MDHKHTFYFPAPDGPTSMGKCQCGETREGSNSYSYGASWGSRAYSKKGAEAAHSARSKTATSTKKKGKKN